jgi:hypothetical protein
MVGAFMVLVLFGGVRETWPVAAIALVCAAAWWAVRAFDRQFHPWWTGPAQSNLSGLTLGFGCLTLLVLFCHAIDATSFPPVGDHVVFGLDRLGQWLSHVGGPTVHLAATVPILGMHLHRAVAMRATLVAAVALAYPWLAKRIPRLQLRGALQTLYGRTTTAKSAAAIVLAHTSLLVVSGAIVTAGTLLAGSPPYTDA